MLGLVGTNGIGKSTALKILANKLRPNLGRYEKEPGWEEVLQVCDLALHCEHAAFPWLGAAELLYKNAGGQPQGGDQASGISAAAVVDIIVRRQYCQVCERNGEGDD